MQNDRSKYSVERLREAADLLESGRPWECREAIRMAIGRFWGVGLPAVLDRFARKFPVEYQENVIEEKVHPETGEVTTRVVGNRTVAGEIEVALDVERAAMELGRKVCSSTSGWLRRGPLTVRRVRPMREVRRHMFKDHDQQEGQS